MNRTGKALLGILGILLVLVLFNGVARAIFSRAYLDLTDENIYSLSDSTKRMLADLKDPLTLKYYFSRSESGRYPALKLYGQRILDLVREYENRSNGKVTLEIFDPLPDTEEEEWAQRYGITAMPLRTGEQIFMGLVGISSTGEERAIPIFDMGREEFLEYDITKMVYSLNLSKRPVVGIISTLELKSAANPMPNGMPGEQQNPQYFFTSQLEELADVKYLETGVTSIDPAIKVLLLIHPKDLSDETLYQIDQFVMRGGRLFVFIDPHCEADVPKGAEQNPMLGMTAEKGSNLTKLLSPWGVELIEKKVVADINLATQVSAGPGGAPQPFVLFLSLNQQNISRDDVSTKTLKSMLLPWAGALKIKPVEGITVEPFLKSTTEAMLVDEKDYKFGGGEPRALIQRYVKGNEELVLAAMIRGKLKSAFPQGNPSRGAGAEKSDPNMSTSTSHLNAATGDGTVFVIADADFLGNQYSVAVQNVFGTQLVQLRNDNLYFVQNVTERLFDSSDLIDLRSRGRFSRPFSRVQSIESNAEVRWRQEEMAFQAKLDGANRRLNELQSQNRGGDSAGAQQAFNSAMAEEIKKIRMEKKDAQQRLREVRRRLREDKEGLGEILFLINSFLIPILLITYWVIRSNRVKKAGTGIK